MTTIIAGLIILFGLAAFTGAPYLPTRRRDINHALDILDLKDRQVLVDLGCGDGSTLLHAARRGLIVIGYEINPLLALVAWLRTRHYGRRVKVVWGDMWEKPIPKNVDGIYIFLIGRLMAKMEAKLAKEVKNVKVVSYSFKLPNRKEIKKDGPFYVYKF